MIQYKPFHTGLLLRTFNIGNIRYDNTRPNTATNNKPVMGVTATYTAEDGALETITLALKEVIGVHEGKNLASVFMEVIKEWEIASQLGFFVLDNAANNDTMMQYISLGT